MKKYSLAIITILFITGCGHTTQTPPSVEPRFPEGVEETISAHDPTLEAFKPEPATTTPGEVPTTTTQAEAPKEITTTEEPTTAPETLPEPTTNPEPNPTPVAETPQEPEEPTGGLNIIITTEPEPTTPDPTPTPEPEPEPTEPESTTEIPSTNASYANTLLSLINTYRAKNDLAALTNDTILTNLSVDHSVYMSGKNSLSHDGFNDRYASANRSTCIENVGWNYSTPAAMLGGWKNSDGHNKNMLNKNITHAGVAVTDDLYITFFACSAPR